MSKRTIENVVADSAQPTKKRKGFSVGPANLPDGTYKRKAQKIKNDLIAKAKVKKAYAKIKARQQDEDVETVYDPYVDAEPPANTRPLPDAEVGAPTLELHPDRVAMLQAPEEAPEVHTERSRTRRSRDQPRGRPVDNREDDVNGFRNSKKERAERPLRYTKEFAQAENRRVQLEAKQVAREARDRDRRAMAKARRPGKDGRMKLGRQGTVLLGRVKRMQEEGKI